MASDHAMITLVKRVADRAARDNTRPRPFKVGERSGDPATRAAFLERTALNGDFAGKLDEAAEQSRARGGSAVSGAVAKLVEEAVAAAKSAEQQRAALFAAKRPMRSHGNTEATL